MPYPGGFQNKSVSSSFKWVPWVYSVPGQTGGRRKAFLEWTSIDLSSKLSLTCGGDVNYYKSVHHPIPILPVEIGNIQAISKEISKLSFLLIFQVCSLLLQIDGRRRSVLEDVRKGATLWDYPQGHLVFISEGKSLFL